VSPRGRADVDAAGVLDAAADLLLRYGYDRTTLDDVARAAGISKTTVYQRWGGREALFRAVLRHQHLAMRRHVRDEVGAVAGPVGLRELVAAQVRAYQRHPLMAALLLRDTAVLGRLRAEAERVPLPRDSTVGLVVRLHGAGLVRTDRALPELVAVFSAVFHGFFVTQPLIPEGLRVPADAAPDLLAETVHRAFARAEPLTPAEAAALDEAVRTHVAAAADPDAGTAQSRGDQP
jgi:AcrR family transcriptional regulator